MTSPSLPASPAFLTSPASLAGQQNNTVRRKPQDFDGSVSLEAYLAQFEMLAVIQRWDEMERAVQLVSCLRGPAIEILGHLSTAQRASYTCVTEALERRFGHQHQAEVFRARFRTRVRAHGESLQQLAHDLESLARKAYPGATEDLTMVLLRDQFVDALVEPQMKIYIKQAHPSDLQESLARALEFESFVRTSGSGPAILGVGRHFQARRSQAMDPTSQMSSYVFRGKCWGCDQRGHRQSECTQMWRTGSMEKNRQHQPCCRKCGHFGHLSGACALPEPSTTTQAENYSWLGQGAPHQPEPPRPHSR